MSRPFAPTSVTERAVKFSASASACYLLATYLRALALGNVSFLKSAAKIGS